MAQREVNLILPIQNSQQQKCVYMKNNMIIFDNFRLIFYSILNLKWEKKVFYFNSYMSANSRRNLMIVWKRYLQMFPFCHFKLDLWTSDGSFLFNTYHRSGLHYIIKKKDFFLQGLYHHLLYIHYFELAFLLL